MEGKFPVKSKELPWSRSGEAYVLADSQTNKNYPLDPISFLVWVQCDGKTKLDSIVDIFTVNGNRDIVKAAVSGILDKLANNGLIKWV
jgi:hypothetical protein